MRFGGHETFPIREGWLHKGLRLLIEEPGKLASEEAADRLGVGRNMAKSIRHWLVATGLAKVTAQKRDRATPYEPTQLGLLIWEEDRYFLDLGTWWCLHINLVNAKNHAWIWGWFFKQYGATRFERAVCIEAATRNLNHSESRPPNTRTLQRDVACLLQSYARCIPEERGDPEETNHCPLTELGLMTYYRGSGVFELHRHTREIPPEILGYAISINTPGEDKGEDLDCELHELWRHADSPSKSLALSNESFYETVIDCARAAEGEALQIIGLAGRRVLRVRSLEPLEWMRAYYRAVARQTKEVAV